MRSIEWYKGKGVFWIWIGNSLRFYIKDSRKSQLLFSERKLIGCRKIGPYIVSLRRG